MYKLQKLQQKEKKPTQITQNNNIKYIYLICETMKVKKIFSFKIDMLRFGIKFILKIMLSITPVFHLGVLH